MLHLGSYLVSQLGETFKKQPCLVALGHWGSDMKVHYPWLQYSSVSGSIYSMGALPHIPATFPHHSELTSPEIMSQNNSSLFLTLLLLGVLSQ